VRLVGARSGGERNGLLVLVLEADGGHHPSRRASHRLRIVAPVQLPLSVYVTLVSHLLFCVLAAQMSCARDLCRVGASKMILIRDSSSHCICSQPTPSAYLLEFGILLGAGEFLNVLTAESQLRRPVSPLEQVPNAPRTHDSHLRPLGSLAALLLLVARRLVPRLLLAVVGKEKQKVREKSKESTEVVALTRSSNRYQRCWS
jgi:hypothetical protein